MSVEAESFQGLRVAAFESRRADDLARLIERHQGLPLVSPSMREVPIENNQPAIDFANRLITGQMDVMVFLTGVGTRMLVRQVERHVDRQQFLGAISDIKTVVRGPKPLAALKELGIPPTLVVPEPNTWRELLTTLDQYLPVANQVVGLQEYGVTNPSLIAGLEARGAKVDRVRLYDWDLPTDTAPLEENIRRLVAGEVDVAMFTSGNQVLNVLRLADQMGIESALRRALRNVVIASIGPTTSETLRDNDLPVDMEPSHPKMGWLVKEAAEDAPALVARKRHFASRVVAPAVIAATKPQDKHAAWQDSVFLRACRCEPVEYTPIWLMRQAGRYMPEYRALREQFSFLELCRRPDLCSQIMCTAVSQLGVDAAIIFSDLLPILEPMGMELEFSQGEGPTIHNPVRASSDVDRMMELESADALHFVLETVRQTRADLPEAIPLIGFAGAPFTLASYAIEGGSSRTFLYTKTLMYRDQAAWNTLMGRLARSITVYLKAQIAAGVQAVQLFDTWSGCLGPDDYRKFVLPHLIDVIAKMTPGVPVIVFAAGNPQLLPLLAEAGPQVVGVDWRVGLDEAWNLVGADRGVQGNLDPAALLADREGISRRAQVILNQAGGRPGHIFNLGHGVLPQTPVDNARALVEIVHELSARR